MPDDEVIEGVVIAAEGKAYFIPATELERYEVPAERAAGWSDDVEGFATGALLRPNVSELRAFQGPIGRRSSTPRDEGAPVVEAGVIEFF
jgi:hypothetical protein